MTPAKNPDDFALQPVAILEQLQSCDITHITTVPDYVMLSVYRALDDLANPPELISCSTEDDAVAVAAGLYIGGGRPMVMMQNQGLYASLNAIRALGIDARLPLFMLIGQFGREYDNLGRPARESARPLVRNTERILEALEIDYYTCDVPEDVGNIGKACARAFDGGRPAAALVGHYTAWVGTNEGASN